MHLPQIKVEIIAGQSIKTTNGQSPEEVYLNRMESEKKYYEDLKTLEELIKGYETYMKSFPVESEGYQVCQDCLKVTNELIVQRKKQYGEWNDIGIRRTL